MNFLTGATGYLGGQILQELVDKGARVRALFRDEARIPQRFKQGKAAGLIEWVQGDTTSVLDMLEHTRGMDQVYHCAAVVSFNPADFERMRRINIQGTRHVVNACLENGVKKLCFISSIAALGRSAQNEEINEEKEWEPSPWNSVYAITKHQSELEVWRGHAEGLKVVIVNPSVVIGPAPDYNSGSAWLYKMAWRGLPLGLFPPGVNGFVDVRDVARICRELMESPMSGERFILNAENLPFKSFFDVASRVMGKPAPARPLTPFMAGLSWRIMSLKKLLTGRRSAVTRESMRTALKKTFYRNQKVLEVAGRYKFYQPVFRPIKETIEDGSRGFLASRRPGLS